MYWHGNNFKHMRERAPVFFFSVVQGMKQHGAKNLLPEWKNWHTAKSFKLRYMAMQKMVCQWFISMPCMVLRWDSLRRSQWLVSVMYFKSAVFKFVNTNIKTRHFVVFYACCSYSLRFISSDDRNTEIILFVVCI